MRIFFLGNNWVGWQVIEWLKEQGEQIVGLALHPPRKRKYGDEIIQNAQVSPEHIFDGTQLHQPKVLERIKGDVYFFLILKDRPSYPLPERR